jgi:alpha-glucosidase
VIQSRNHSQPARFLFRATFYQVGQGEWMKTERANTIGFYAFILIVGTLWTFVASNFVSLARENKTGTSPLPIPSSEGAKSDQTHLSNGIQIKRGEMLLSVVALRDDVLRIRLANNGALPEDASWAVAPEIRNGKADVVPETSADAAGFHTKALRVRIERVTLRLTVSDLEGNILQEDVPGWPAEFHGGAFRLYKKMPADEHYFGLGDKVGPLDRRGQSFRLWGTDAFLFQESTDPIYKSIPFFLTMRGGKSAGFLFDNTWSTNFDFGRGEREMYSFAAEGGPIDYYIFSGPEPKQVVRTYAWLTGLPPLPPLWTLGFQQSRFSYETEARVREIARRLRADKIPSDTIYLDIDFQQEHRPFTVDNKNFPHFDEMLADLKRDHFHVVVITDLHVAHLPNAGYAPYDSGAVGDHFVKNPDGSTYVGTVWPGPSVFPEFTRPKTREWWGTLYQPFVKEGVAGFWNDMNEPSVFQTPNGTMPNDTRHRIEEPGFRPRTASHLEIHNVFGMENSRATYEGLLKLNPDVRPFVLTRASYAGGQRYAATWTGDNTASWNHFRLTTPMLLNLGLSGFGFCGADVGGFIGTPRPELLTRWTELATFQPIDRNHTNKGAGDKEVWVDGPEQEAIRRRYIEERYRLLPYLYTLVEEFSRTGMPVVRPLFLEFPGATADRHPFDLDAGNEFLFGPSLLVAPAPFAEQPDRYSLKLPPGVWYDYWTGETISAATKDGKAVSESALWIEPKLDTLPVYVREGSILPMQPLVQSAEETPAGDLTLRVYPGNECHGSLYMDDGKTFAYKRGESMRMNFSCAKTPDGVAVHIGQHEGSYRPWWKEIRIELYGWSSSTALANVGKNPGSSAVTVDAARHAAVLNVPDDGNGMGVDFRNAN